MRHCMWNQNQAQNVSQGHGQEPTQPPAAAECTAPSGWCLKLCCHEDFGGGLHLIINLFDPCSECELNKHIINHLFCSLSG